MTAEWTTAPWLCIDTETTGVQVFTDRIVEVAAVALDTDGQIRNVDTDAYTAIINPGIDIPDGAAAVHGITTERAQTEGQPPTVALAEIAELIRYAQDLDMPLVMFNARFDWPLLLVEAERHGVTDFPSAAPILDPYLIDRLVDRYRKGKRQLTMVAEHYDVELGDAAHGALADATAAGRVMRRIVDQHPEIGQRSLASMLLWQVRGHEEDRLRFEDYMRRNVDPKFETVAGWPIPVAMERAS
jgi:DNA polymerase-3 subunit epsilon